MHDPGTTPPWIGDTGWAGCCLHSGIKKETMEKYGYPRLLPDNGFSAPYLTRCPMKLYTKKASVPYKRSAGRNNPEYRMIR